jgi:predicted RND superfamily exporter protein
VPSKRGPIVIGLLSAAAALASLNLSVDNSRDRMLQQHSPAARAYDEFVREFGDESVVIVALSGKPLFEFESLDEMVLAADRLAGLPHVTSVNGLPIIFRDTFGEEDNVALEEELTSTPFYRGLFLSEDGTTTGILVELDGSDESGSAEGITAAIEQAVQPLRDFGFRVDLIGQPVFQSTINHLTQSETIRMFPIAALVSLLVLIALLRSVRATLVVLVCSATTLLLTMGTMAATGHTLNMVTASSPLILWVLSLANSIHIVSRYQRVLAVENGPAAAIARTMAELTYSCALASVTTAFGFVSLSVARVSAVQELGIYMGAGMIISLVVSLMLAPWLLVTWKIAPVSRARHDSRVLAWFGRVITRHHVPALVVTGIFIGVAIFYALKVEADPDTLDFLQKDNPTAESFRFVAGKLTGFQSLEIVVDTPGGWTNSAYWPAIERLTERVAQEGVVVRAYSPLEFVKKINQWEHEVDPAYYTLPETSEEAEHLLSLMNDDDRDRIRRFTTEDDSRIRISVLLNSMNSKEFDSVIQAAETGIRELPPPLAGYTTGMAARMHEFEYGLVTTQIVSYAASFVMVFGSILIGLRSLRLTLFSIPPNILPMLAVFTTMGAFHLSLNVATVMVASISLGIAVDNTVHLLANYRRLRLAGTRGHEAIRETLVHVGPACVVTTVTACIGFFTLAASVFIPIANFGLLSGIAMLAALAADLVLVPSILAFGGDNR